MDHLLPVPVAPQPSSLLKHADQVSKYAESALSANTRRGYRADWRDFAAWCEARSQVSLPAQPETVASYLADRAQSLRTSTLARRQVSISQAHELAGLPNPCKDARVRTVWQGITREHGAPPKKKKAMAVNDLRLLVGSCATDLVGCRDKALLLIGFFTGMRRSEIVSLDVEDITVDEDKGVRLLLRRSKTDATGMGREVGVPVGRHAATCPVLALRAWLHASGISRGPLFRPLTRWGTVRGSRLSAHAVSLLIKKRTAALGLDPDLYAGHSLRSGMITAAARAGVAEHVIARTTNHRSIATLRGYIQSANLLQEHPAHALDL